ncbi:MAG: translation initiation factor IF-2 N-terminal domain-containing protein, partial [Kiritimatiellae bacterium]|nr:translation initiation factor IF-2 N-terminal domain-containing protein [Kiritimatiellia bacterium]
MKIYELAKQVAAKAGDLAKIAREQLGIDKAGNFTNLTDDQATRLAQLFAKPSAPTPPEPPAVDEEAKALREKAAAR